MSIRTGIMLALLMLAGTGCRLGPVYEPPAVAIPLEWKACEAEAYATCVGFWWEVFQDDTLSDLEATALTNSPNLDQALARVMEARALVEINASALYPQLNVTPSYTDSGQLYKLFLPPGVFPGPKPDLSVFRIHQYQYVLPINLNYEVDLWGKLRSQVDASIYTAQAQEEDYFNLLLTLTTDIASNYFQLRLLDTQIAILKSTLEERNKALSINKSRYQKGLGNTLDIASASLEVSNTESSYYDALRQRVLLENIIATLVGTPASDFCIEASPLEGEPPSIPAGIPSEVLLRRPDIAEAERKTAAQNAQIGVANASIFPSLSLTGTLGYSSPDIRQFLKWISRLWSLGVNVNQTVFDGGFNEGNIIEAWARFLEASSAYQQLVLVAFQDVENALSNLEHQAKQSSSLADAVDAARLRHTLAAQRYRSGLTNYLEVIDSQNTELTAQLSLANIQGQRFVSTVQLIKALGGSW